MATRSRTTKQARVLALVAGVQKHLLNASLTVYSTTFTGAELVQALQGQATASGVVAITKAAWQPAVKTDNDPAAAALITQFTQVVRLMYASSIDVLANFGIAPPKTQGVDRETQVASAAKARRATRAARHTTGKIQKKDIKGTVATSAPALAAPSSAPPPPSGSSGSIPAQ